MNKSELIVALAEEMNFPEKISRDITDTILCAMTDALAKGENIEIRGFGSITIKKYGSYTGRNPKTGKETIVKEKKLPFFKVGKELKLAVNASKKQHAQNKTSK